MGVNKPYTGRLLTPVVFKRNRFTSSGGGSEDDFETFCTTRCDLTPKTQSKINDRNQVIISQFYEIVLRYQSSLFNNLTGTVIAVINNENYIIHSFDLMDNRKQFMKLTISKIIL